MDLLLLAKVAAHVAPDLVPYGILLINCIIFKFARLFLGALVYPWLLKLMSGDRKAKRQNRTASFDLLRLFINELISTCEMCAGCAELNIVYEKHGSIAYGLALCLLTYLWIESFGDAHTTPAYIIEDLVIYEGNKLLKSSLPYARLVGQMIAMPLAWRFASIYWRYHFLEEHSKILMIERCQSSLTVTTVLGFLIECICSLICRLLELVSQNWVKNRTMRERNSTIICSLVSTILVVLALETSGGYFNPILAGTLEFGCKGISLWQHVIVFWLGPMIGHVAARMIHNGLSRPVQPQKRRHINDKVSRSESRRVTRSVGPRRND